MKAIFILLMLLVAGVNSFSSGRIPYQIQSDLRLNIMNAKEQLNDGHFNVYKKRLVIVSWNEFGRKRKNCNGFGLCDATWFTVEQASSVNPRSGYDAILQYNEQSRQFYFDIVLTNEAPAGLSTIDGGLMIDESIRLDTRTTIGFDLTIEKGTISFDRGIGNFGGFRVPMNSEE
jgi:hypothetical protein